MMEFDFFIGSQTHLVNTFSTRFIKIETKSLELNPHLTGSVLLTAPQTCCDPCSSQTLADFMKKIFYSVLVQP